MKEKKQILVVDDDPTFRHLMVELLSGEGRRVAPVLNGEEGLQRLREARFDIAILGLNLAGWISGIDFLRGARRLYPEIKVILCGALTDKATMEEVLTLGAEVFAPRPVENPEGLLALVKKMSNGADRSALSRAEEGGK